MTSNALKALIGRIPDRALREMLEAEIRVLRDTKEFGLVFERHFPENVRLLGHPINRGARVQKRDPSEGNENFVVKEIVGDSAVLVTKDGGAIRERLDQLVVVREFYEPVFPGLRHLGATHRSDDPHTNLVIKAENHHALHALLYAYESRVDCIYIDPPFNSGGARDWKYNNDYVAKDDAYRHSKWLSFMEKRLQIAKRLLNPSESVLIVAIDENEVHRLHMLLEQIFPASKIQMVTVLINPAGASIIDQFDRVDEQLFFVHVGSASPARTVAETTPLNLTRSNPDEEQDEKRRPKAVTWESLQRSGGNSRRRDTKAKFFPVYVDEKARSIVGCGDHVPLDVPRQSVGPPPSDCVHVWPIKQDGSEACWQLSAPTFRKYLKAGRIRLGRRKKNGGWGISFLTKGHMRAIEAGEIVVTGRDKGGALIVENSKDKPRTRVGKTIWINGAYSATEHGSTLLRKFIPGRKFPFPKSLYAVEDALRFYVGHKPEALVLDFFAGSGTTAHAVARLNRQDGGKRTSISITNNEVSAEEASELLEAGLLPGDLEWEARGIFEYITRPRIDAAITGLTPEGDPIEGAYRFIDESPIAEGFKENVDFFELIYLDHNSIARQKAFAEIAPMLWLKAGGCGQMIKEEGNKFAAPANANYAVLFDVNYWPKFVDAIRERSDLQHVFIVTDSLALFQQIVAELPFPVEASMLYEDYLRNFEISLGVMN